MKKWLLLYCCWLAGFAAAQDLPATTQQQLENLGDEALEDDALLQQLAYYRKHPLNLNTATAEELQTLRFLTDLQIANFIRYRKLAGKLIDIYELQAVPTFDLLTIQKILPYIAVSSASFLKETLLSRLKGGESYLLLRASRQLEKPVGYNTSRTTHYLGDPSRLQVRYRYQYKNSLYCGLLGDKDAGEPFFQQPAKAGFEFYSFHFFARNIGKIKALAIGDYTVNLGQGMVQWQALAFGKSVDVMNIKRQLPTLQPYRSAGEFYFNRGVGVTLAANRWELTTFFSRKRFSGNLAFDSVEHFTSFNTSGYYRTKNEVADRNQLVDVSGGGNLTYRSENLRLAWNAAFHHFSLPMQKADEPYNNLAFRGRQLLNQSLDYSYTHRNVHFFGEAAIDRKGNKAVVQGLLLSLDKRVDLSLLYRSISMGYQAPFGNAFTENTLPGNEQGLYTGLAIRPTIGWQLAAYADFYRFPFIKYRVSAPTRGSDYLFQATYTPSRQSEIYLRYRTETKPINLSGTSVVLQYPVDQRKQNLRLHMASRISPLFTLKARAEMVLLERQTTEKEEGFLGFLELSSELVGRCRGNLRLQYFETNSYDSRIYTYESDVMYYFSIPAFFEKGFRYYLNLSYEPSKHLQFWIKWAQTAHRDKASIGSGLDEINGDCRSEIRLQAQIRF